MTIEINRIEKSSSYTIYVTDENGEHYIICLCSTCLEVHENEFEAGQCHTKNLKKNFTQRQLKNIVENYKNLF